VSRDWKLGIQSNLVKMKRKEDGEEREGGLSGDTRCKEGKRKRGGKEQGKREREKPRASNQVLSTEQQVTSNESNQQQSDPSGARAPNACMLQRPSAGEVQQQSRHCPSDQTPSPDSVFIELRWRYGMIV
jgi:hypothetical protein